MRKTTSSNGSREARGGRRRWIALSALGLAAAVAAGAALGSPGTPSLRHAVTLVTGNRSDDIRTRAITPEGAKASVKLVTGEPVNVVMQEISYDPAGASGWHHHPGVVLAAVKSGQFKFYEDLGKKQGCTVHTFNAGDVFVESGDTPANLRNETAAPAVIDVTFIVPMRGPPPVVRLDDTVRCGIDP